MDLETDQGLDRVSDQVTGLDWDQAKVRKSVPAMVRESVRD